MLIELGTRFANWLGNPLIVNKNFEFFKYSKVNLFSAG